MGPCRLSHLLGGWKANTKVGHSDKRSLGASMLPFRTAGQACHLETGGLLVPSQGGEQGSQVSSLPGHMGRGPRRTLPETGPGLTGAPAPVGENGCQARATQRDAPTGCLWACGCDLSTLLGMEVTQAPFFRDPQRDREVRQAGWTGRPEAGENPSAQRASLTARRSQAGTRHGPGRPGTRAGAGWQHRRGRRSPPESAARLLGGSPAGPTRASRLSQALPGGERQGAGGV